MLIEYNELMEVNLKEGNSSEYGDEMKDEDENEDQYQYDDEDDDDNGED